MLTINKTWHKQDSSIAMTYKQLQFINSLRTDTNIKGWDFPSSSSAMKQLTKDDASAIIDALKNNETVEII